MIRFCYREYQYRETEEQLAYFNVDSITEDSLRVTDTVINKLTQQPAITEISLEILQDSKKQMEYVEIAGQKVYAADYYNPEIKAGFYL